MRPRCYSISSSPAAASSCHLTVGVLLRGPTRSGHGTFSGVASGHLESGMEGSTVFTFIRKPTIPFHPPANPHVPMIMIGAGAGMAPFRGFLQDTSWKTSGARRQLACDRVRPRSRRLQRAKNLTSREVEEEGRMTDPATTVEVA